MCRVSATIKIDKFNTSKQCRNIQRIELPYTAIKSIKVTNVRLYDKHAGIARRKIISSLFPNTKKIQKKVYTPTPPTQENTRRKVPEKKQKKKNSIPFPMPGDTGSVISLIPINFWERMGKLKFKKSYLKLSPMALSSNF